MPRITRQDQRLQFNRETWSSCNSCHGRGMIQPMIQTNPEYTCDGCNGIGWIPPDGQPLNEHEAIRLLRDIIKKQSRSIKILRARTELSEENPEDRHTGGGIYNGGRYVGD